MPRLPHRLGLRLGVAAGLIVALAPPLAVQPVAAQTTPPTSAAAQPTLQPPSKQSPSPIVESIVGPPPPVLEVRKREARQAGKPVRRRLVHARHHGRPLDVDRPALAGVLLVEPIPDPLPRPRPIVPAPAYFIDGIASALTIPPPPVVCAHRRRDPDLPDPRLYREVPVVCGYDLD